MASPIPREPPVTIATLPVSVDMALLQYTADLNVTVAIIGAGELGGAIAHAVATRDRVGRVLIVDAAANVAAGKALDIQQSGPVVGFHTTLEGTDDMSRATGCRVCVIADRAGESPSEWQGEDGLAMLTRLSPYLGDAPIVFAGASQASLISMAGREARIPRGRLIGSSLEALVSAIAAIVAMEAQCAADEVGLTVLGTPPAGLVVLWSEASIGGYTLDRVLSQVQLTRLAARTARLWPPGAYTLGAAAARIVEAILESSRRSFSVLTVLNGEFGARNRVGAIPALLASPGIVHTRTPALTTRERVLLESALGA
jgi:malate dehydrogenase